MGSYMSNFESFPGDSSLWRVENYHPRPLLVFLMEGPLCPGQTPAYEMPLIPQTADPDGRLV